MHPLISGWLKYKELADLQISYHDHARYTQWIIQCNAAMRWLKQLGFKR
jgi:hypothetical protein